MITARFFLVLALAAFLSACSADAPAPDSTVALPYSVGSQTFVIHDPSRPYDDVAGVDHGVRTMITEVWYPVEHAVIDNAGGRWKRATYGDYVFGDRDMHRRMMTQTTFFHLTPDTVRDGITQVDIDAAIDELFERERASYIGAPLADIEGRLPVVVMTHGDAGSRYNMETACEYLAAHGYFVIAPEHTGNSPYSLTGRDPALGDEGDPDLREKMSGVLALLDEHGAYGGEETYGQSYAPSASGRDAMTYLRDLDLSLLQRLNDLRATLDELEKINLSGFANAPPGFLDLKEVGLMGRSFGGATTLVGLSMEPQFTAGFAVVPPGWTDPRPSLPDELLTAQESVLFAAEGPFPLTDLSKPTVLLHGAEDALIIGLGARMAATEADAPTPDNPHPLLHKAFQQSDARVAWGMLADANHATFGVSGDYWWPELKPATQARYFQPDVKFELFDTQLAHTMQKELALAFFDTTIRKLPDARARLLDNDYGEKGLRLEFRNF